MYDRIKQLRLALNLSQQKFADKLGIARGNIAAYEVGKNLPSDAVISLICKTFPVNEDWLRTGTGEMFLERTKDDEIAEMIGEIHIDNENHFKRRFITALTKLDKDDWDSLEKLVDEIVNQKKEGD